MYRMVIGFTYEANMYKDRFSQRINFAWPKPLTTLERITEAERYLSTCGKYGQGSVTINFISPAEVIPAEAADNVVANAAVS